MEAVINSKNGVKIEKEIKKISTPVETKGVKKEEKCEDDFFDVFAMVNKNAEQARLMRENSALRLENGRLKYKLSRIEKRKEERKRFILKTLEFLFLGAGCLFIGWMLISYINVIANNLTTPENIWDWNFFKVMVRFGEMLGK